MQTQSSYADISCFVEGNFQININEQIFFSQTEFPILEFAMAANTWLEAIDKNSNDVFKFESIDHKGPILIFENAGNSKLLIRSEFPEKKVSPLLNKYDVTKELKEFIDNVKDSLTKG